MTPASFTWSQLGSLQRAFGSKAAVALPAVSFAVAILPETWVETWLLPNWRLHVVFWGALLFLVGQGVIAWRRPIAFDRGTDVPTAIDEAKSLATFDYLKDRGRQLASQVERYSKVKPRGLADIELQIAATRAKAATEANEDAENDWTPLLPLVVVSQRRLDEYDRWKSRVAAVLLLGVGLVFMALPAVVNFVTALASLVRSYW